MPYYARSGTQPARAGQMTHQAAPARVLSVDRYRMIYSNFQIIESQSTQRIPSKKLFSVLSEYSVAQLMYNLL